MATWKNLSPKETAVVVATINGVGPHNFLGFIIIVVVVFKFVTFNHFVYYVVVFVLLRIRTSIFHSPFLTSLPPNHIMDIIITLFFFFFFDHEVS